MSKKEIRHISDSRSLRIKATFNCEFIHAQETGWQSDVRSCILSGLSTHYMEELNVGTVVYAVLVEIGQSCRGGWYRFSKLKIDT